MSIYVMYLFDSFDNACVKVITGRQANAELLMHKHKDIP